MTITLIWTLLGSFLVTVFTGRYLVPYLRKIKAGQSIKTDGPTWHMSKQGTPTMGGVMFIAGIVFACVICGLREMAAGDLRHIIVLGFALIYGAIGFLDDYEKLKKKQNLGLTAIQKFFLQLAAAIVLILFLRNEGYLSPSLYIPFADVTVQLNEVVYYILAAFIIVGGVNAVNITDGIDGLAAGVTLPVALFYMVISAVWGYASVGIFGAAMAGGLAGFLIFNFHPAKIFMGDTGSLFLGGAVCAAAFALDMPLILVPIGIIYIIETLSDIIQVTYFKLTHGKRVFKMAPLHHHLEMSGWSEKKIFTVFTTISALFCIIAYLAVKSRYNI